METNFKNKQEALDAIKLIENYIKNLDSKESKLVEMENIFLGLMNQGLTLKIDSEKQRINYYKDDQLIILIELKKEVVWFDYHGFWLIFESKFSLNHQEIKEFLNSMVDKHLNYKGFTTQNV